MRNLVTSVLLPLAIVLSLPAGCAGPGWPDEPGVPVASGQVANLEAGESFIEGLTARRAGQTIPAPLLTPGLQESLRPIAERLESGTLSARRALELGERWGRAAYRRDVDAWVLDCAAGRDMWLPDALIARPTAVISYAPAHFRPRSAAADQCAIIVVSANGSDVVSAARVQ